MILIVTWKHKYYKEKHRISVK